MGLMFPIYFISLIISAGLGLMTASQILDLSDLDCDYINPQQCCIKLNRLVMPELLCVGLVVVLHLMTLNWIPTATFLPMLAWLIYTHRSNSQGYVNLYDTSTICDQRVINKHVRRNFFKTIHYIIHFVAFLYVAILELNTTQ
uniref:Protein cornichon 4 n=1 Tax=Aceria tosichella TaxID=561515 RepID=A0A6G1SCH6_9ACAR